MANARVRRSVERRPFNVIDPQTGWKVDLIILKARAFSREEFRRLQRVELIEGVHLALATPEDTILSKLEWAKKAGGSGEATRGRGRRDRGQPWAWTAPIWTAGRESWTCSTSGREFRAEPGRHRATESRPSKRVVLELIQS